MKDIVLSVRRHTALLWLMKAVSEVLRIAFILAYAYAFHRAMLLGWVPLIILVLKTGLPFILVSLFRRMIDAPRPYELYGISGKAPRKKCGESFPSRHVFSAVLISFVYFEIAPYIALILLSLSLLLCISRVLLGIHFVRDVLFGILIGATLGALLFLA